MKKIAALFLALMLLVPMGAFAASTYTINFAYENRNDDVELLNAMLASMELASLDLEDPDTYLATTRNSSGTVIDRRLGLDAGTFLCELPEEGETGYIYQLMTDVVDLNVDHDTFTQSWRDAHPDLVMRIVFRIEYDGGAGYVIVYHARRT